MIDEITKYFKSTKVSFIKYGNSFNSIDSSANVTHAAF
jgi:hypothetical protein